MSDREGMVPREKWAETDVHKSSTYACGFCGKRFADPDAVYDHLDAEHADEQAKRHDR